MSDGNNRFVEINQESDEKHFNLKDFVFHYILRFWYLYIITICLSLVIAYYYNWYTTPVYRASCSVLIKLPAKSSDATDFLMQMESYTTDRNIQNEIELLKSRTLILKTIRDLNLDASFYLQGNVKTSERYNNCPFKVTIDSLKYLSYSEPVYISVLNESKFRLSFTNQQKDETFEKDLRFGEKIQSDLGVFTVDKTDHFSNVLFNDQDYEKRDFILKFQTFESLIEKYSPALKVEPLSKQSSILQMTFEDAVPEKAVDFLNKLIEVWIANGIDEKNQIVRNTLEFIDEQLELISKDLSEIETSLEQFKAEKGITDLGAEANTYLGSVKDYDTKISEIELQISFLNYIEKYVRQNKDIKEISPTSIGINDPILLKLMNQLSEVENKRNQLLLSAREDNPAIISINAQSRNLRNSLLETIKSTRDALNDSKNQAYAQLGRIEGKIRVIPGSQRQLVTIQRQNQLKESLYTYLMQKRAEYAIVLASTTSDNRIVDIAHVSSNPVKPVKAQVYAIALFLALVFPLAFAYSKEIFDDKIIDKNHLESNTKIPLLGIVGYNNDSLELVVQRNPKSQIAEAFRSIRTNLQFFYPPGNKCNVVLITSSISSEGKSFCALNLASIIALSGKKTVLVGFDLRKPKSPDRFDLKSNIGVSSYLIGAATEKEIIQASGVENLSFILSGPKPPNPSELMMNERMDLFFDYLKKEFDCVILDSPPLGLITDAMLLSKYANATVYVVRQNVTRKGHLDIVNKLHKEGKIKT